MGGTHGSRTTANGRCCRKTCRQAPRTLIRLLNIAVYLLRAVRIVVLQGVQLSYLRF
jgi:hypothetical protein